MKKFKHLWKSYLKDIIMIIFGTTIMSIGVIGFYSQASITPSGLYGLATILCDVILQNPNELILRIAAGLVYLSINFIALLFIMKKMGKKFVLNITIGIINYILLNILLQYTPIKNYVYNNLVSSVDSIAPEYGILCCIFGGVLLGIGLGFVLRNNGSTGGCDLLAMAVNKVNPSITPGQIMTIVDTLVVLSCFSFYNIKASLYALIGIYVCNNVADMMLNGVNSLQAYFIITTNPTEVSDLIIKYVKRGVTKIDCEGMYSKKDKYMLLTIVKKKQVYLLKQVIKAYDPQSFMFSVSAKEAYGLGFVNFNNLSHETQIKKLSKLINEDSNELNTSNN